jgi:hypothetical protein
MVGRTALTEYLQTTCRDANARRDAATLDDEAARTSSLAV